MTEEGRKGPSQSQLTFACNHDPDIDGHRTMHLSNTICCRRPFRDKYYGALLKNEARVVVGFEGRDISILIQIYRATGRSAVDDSNVRREGFVLRAVDESRKTVAVVARGDDVRGGHTWWRKLTIKDLTCSGQ